VPRGSLEVIEYVARPALPEPSPAEHPSVSQILLSRLGLEPRTLMSCAAAFGAIALHALFIVPAIWVGGGSQHAQRQRYQGDSAMQWVVIVDSPGKSATVRSTSPPTLKAIGVSEALLMQQPSKLPVDYSDAGSGQTDGQSGSGEKYGRYLGQIRARIDRAWLRPRSAIGAPIFQCLVQVDQDRVGRVQEVTLLSCNGGASWQLSLVHAIEAASPLPAPSDEAVFVHHVLLAFRAMAYAPGEPAELYEPAHAARASGDPRVNVNHSQNAFQALREATRAPKPKVLKLQIEGSKVDVEPDRQ